MAYFKTKTLKLYCTLLYHNYKCLFLSTHTYTHTAGGLAVYYSLDYVRTLLPNSVALTGLADAGLVVDGINSVITIRFL